MENKRRMQELGPNALTSSLNEIAYGNSSANGKKSGNKRRATAPLAQPAGIATRSFRRNMISAQGLSEEHLEQYIPHQQQDLSFEQDNMAEQQDPSFEGSLTDSADDSHGNVQVDNGEKQSV